MATKARRRMRGPERRAQIIEVARKAFGKKSFHSVTMDAVAREAGVTKPILYDHFPSKRHLYLALLESDLALLKEQVRVAMRSSPGNRERIRAGFQAYFDFVDEHAEGFRLLMTEAIGNEGDVRGLIDDWKDELHEEVAALIFRESEGRLDRTEAEVVALGLIGMAETTAQQNVGAKKRERKRAVDTLVRLAWRGITGV